MNRIFYLPTSYFFFLWGFICFVFTSDCKLWMMSDDIDMVYDRVISCFLLSVIVNSRIVPFDFPCTTASAISSIPTLTAFDTDEWKRRCFHFHATQHLALLRVVDLDIINKQRWYDENLPAPWWIMKIIKFVTFCGVSMAECQGSDNFPLARSSAPEIRIKINRGN